MVEVRKIMHSISNIAIEKEFFLPVTLTFLELNAGRFWIKHFYYAVEFAVPCGIHQQQCGIMTTNLKKFRSKDSRRIRLSMANTTDSVSLPPESQDVGRVEMFLVFTYSCNNLPG